MTELVDYSRTATSDWAALAAALKARGFVGAGRYATSDKSPSGRGVTAAEYAAFRAAGMEMFFYYERSAGWMVYDNSEYLLSPDVAFAIGVPAARDAHANLTGCGAPPATPIVFAHDIEPNPAHYATVDATLRGCASVIGPERTWLYGGRRIIDHCRDAMWDVTGFVQTHAWSYVNGVLILADGINAIQYNTGTNIIGGANCDYVRALKPIYGQASAYESGPPIVPHPGPRPSVPWSSDDVGHRDLNGFPAIAFRGFGTALRDIPVWSTARGTRPKDERPLATIKQGEEATILGTLRNRSGLFVFVDLGELGIGRARWSGWSERWPRPDRLDR